MSCCLISCDPTVFVASHKWLYLAARYESTIHTKRYERVFYRSRLQQGCWDERQCTFQSSFLVTFTIFILKENSSTEDDISGLFTQMNVKICAELRIQHICIGRLYCKVFFSSADKTSRPILSVNAWWKYGHMLCRCVSIMQTEST